MGEGPGLCAEASNPWERAWSMRRDLSPKGEWHLSAQQASHPKGEDTLSAQQASQHPKENRHPSAQQASLLRRTGTSLRNRPFLPKENRHLSAQQDPLPKENWHLSAQRPLFSLRGAREASILP